MSKSYHRYLKTPFEFQKVLLKLFKRRSELVIFDIGACEGEDSIKYATLFPRSRVFSFEPLPSNVERFKTYVKKYKKSNIRIYNTALSDQTGSATFYVSSGAPHGLENNEEWDHGNKSSSLLAPDLVTEKFDWLKFEREITVSTQTLDIFCTENHIGQIDFIHMDVQGAELLVLNGATHMISKLKAIWLEVENVSLYKDQPLKAQIEAYMHQKGFVKLIDNVGAISGDQFYINPLLTSKVATANRIRNSFRSVKKRIFDPEKKFKKSYSQSGEDLVINYIFNQIGIEQPSFLDIGAHHPYYLSNTAFFYERGCRGINIEPDPALFKLFPTYRRQDINIQAGIGTHDEELELNRMSVPTMNTFSDAGARELVDRHAFAVTGKTKTSVYTVGTILEKYNQGLFPHLLSLDVEGFDEDIIRSIDFSGSKPIVICVETISYSAAGKGEKNHSIIAYLKEKGYLLYADTYINTIFVLENAWLRD